MTPDFYDRLYEKAEAIVQDEIARHGQGSLFNAMWTVTAPAILDLVANGRKNAAARWIARLDGATGWRTVGKVLGTQALTNKVAGLFLDDGLTAKARMLWKAIVVARRSQYWAGAKQIELHERHYKGRRSPPKDVVKFLEQCHELTDDVKAAFFAGVKEYSKLCDQYRWPREAERVAMLAAEVEQGRYSRTRSGPLTKKMTPQWYRELLAAARQDAGSDEWMCDRLADLLEGVSIAAIVTFKRTFLSEANTRLSALNQGAGRDLPPDEAEDVATSLTALLGKAAADAKMVRKARKTNRADCGGPAFAFEAPDLAFRNLVMHNEVLFSRMNKDFGD
jgi:hypothetical protein